MMMQKSALPNQQKQGFDKNPLLLLQLVGWLIYGVADSLDHILKGYDSLLPTLVCSTSAFLLTGLTGYITNQNEHRGVVKQSLIFAVLILLATVLWHKVWAVLHGDATTNEAYLAEFAKVADYSLIQWLSTGYYPLFLFLAWSGFFFGAKWFLAHRTQQQQLVQALLATKQAQLQTLRYQLNPHFLFNVLNSVDVSVLSDDKHTAHLMLKHLSGFLRNSLAHGEQDKIPLKQEFEIVNDFIGIERLRFGDALKLSVELPVECEQAMLPPMLLQPMVENAIKFAWSQSQQGSVELRAAKQMHQLSIVIKNSKAQQPEDKAGTGTGLRNTAQRLKLVYGEDAVLQAEDQQDFFAVTLRLPWEVALT